eukprot:1242621-Rhodomonas_salina.3
MLEHAGVDACVASAQGLAWLFLGVANKDALLYDEEFQVRHSSCVHIIYLSRFACGLRARFVYMFCVCDVELRPDGACGVVAGLPPPEPRQDAPRLRSVPRGPPQQEGWQDVHPGTSLGPRSLSRRYAAPSTPRCSVLI